MSEIYGATEISERHRHRYEVNTAYKGRLEQHGMRFCGMSPDGVLPEIIEYAGFIWRCPHRTLAVARRCGPVSHLTLSAPDPRGRSAVRTRAVSPRAQVAAVRAAPAVCLVRRGGGGAEQVGVGGGRHCSTHSHVRVRSNAVDIVSMSTSGGCKRPSAS